jgi:hypothetical protein
VLNELKDSDTDLKDITGTINKDVVPDTDAEAERETIEEERLKPFLQPEQVRDADLLEVLIKLWELFLEDVIELIEVLLE